MILYPIGKRMSNFFQTFRRLNENQIYFYHRYTRCAAIGAPMWHLLPILLLRTRYRLVPIPSEIVRGGQTLVPHAAGTGIFFFTPH